MTNTEAEAASKALAEWAERRKRQRVVAAYALVSYPLGAGGFDRADVGARWRISLLQAGAHALNAA